MLPRSPVNMNSTSATAAQPPTKLSIIMTPGSSDTIRRQVAGRRRSLEVTPRPANGWPAPGSTRSTVRDGDTVRVELMGDDLTVSRFMPA